MDSLNLFDDKPIESPAPPPPLRRRPHRPVWQILLAGAILPGLGQILLGRMREGLVLLGACMASQLLATLAFAMAWTPLTWIALRAGGAIYLFAIGDAALRLYEQSDGRYRMFPESPRRVAFWNLVGYGAGYEILGERRWALGVGGTALFLHAVLAFAWWPAILFGEALLLASAVHAWWLAAEQKRRLDPEPVDSCPLWLRRSLLVSLGLTVLIAVLSQWVSVSWREASHIRRENSVAIEPFYENPHYGLRLEMPSPGWQFLPPMGNELISAAHLTEGAAMSLSVAPRSPLNWSDELWALHMMEEALHAGWDLDITAVESSSLGNLPGIEVEAEGRFRGQPRVVRMVTASRGLQHLTLWYEWSPEPDAFAAHEVGLILASIQVD